MACGVGHSRGSSRWCPGNAAFAVTMHATVSERTHHADGPHARCRPRTGTMRFSRRHSTTPFESRRGSGTSSMRAVASDQNSSTPVCRSQSYTARSSARLSRTAAAMRCRSPSVSPLTCRLGRCRLPASRTAYAVGACGAAARPKCCGSHRCVGKGRRAEPTSPPPPPGRTVRCTTRPCTAGPAPHRKRSVRPHGAEQQQRRE